MNFWVQMAVGISAILGAFFLIKNFIAFMVNFFRRGILLYDEFLGTGDPERPSFRERMKKIEDRLSMQDDTLELQNERLAELKPNGGSSLKDQMSQLEARSLRLEAMLNRLIQESDNERARAVSDTVESLDSAST